ncbi:MAG: hypothetical protein HY756_10200 [Nitrospirae bacterium]|nr:hypothetical protein [Nitrospirota bacterium]
MFNLFFNQQEDVSPFLYYPNAAISSAGDFADDYISSFIRQRLAFYGKNTLLLNEEGLSVENLLSAAEKSNAEWAVNILNNYLQVKAAGNIMNMFLSAVSAPYRSYLATGMPVVVMIDDFQGLSDFTANEKRLWVLFEHAVKLRHIPHIITGSHAELQKMFFEETSLGEALDIVNLSGIEEDAAIRLFSLLCETYKITFDKRTWIDTIRLLNGNPSNIRSFIQAVAQKNRAPSANDLFGIYLGEITKGKIHTYWVSALKKHIPSPDLRKASLYFLRHLQQKGAMEISSGIGKDFSVTAEGLNNIVDTLYTTGIIETGFINIRLKENKVLGDFITHLYQKEILKEERVDVAVEEKPEPFIPIKEGPLFELTVPAIPKIELLSFNLLQQIAKTHNIPQNVTGQMQVALADLFNNVLSQYALAEGNFRLNFIPEKEGISVIVHTPPPLSEGPRGVIDLELIRKFSDTVEIESTSEGMIVTIKKRC